MSNSLPTAKSVTSPEEKAKLRRIIDERGLCGLANDTKWDEFISAIRQRKDWNPRFRFKCLDGSVSRWDREWRYHLPFPFLLVEWVDIEYHANPHPGIRMPPETTDHSPWLIDLLDSIGLDYQRGITMIRIFGYSPRNLDLFNQ